jgi:hypothetical protein
MKGMTHSRTFAYGLIAVPLFVLCLTVGGIEAEEGSPIKMNTASAQPRAVEDLTRTALIRDYDRAWRNLAEAFETGSSVALDGYFVGSARKDLGSAVASQRKTGLQSRYLSQEHSVDAVFYAPEGDVIELHDTVRVELQVVDGKKIIHDEHVVLRYVVLMTPAADRWVVRQFQAVPQF